MAGLLGAATTHAVVKALAVDWAAAPRSGWSSEAEGWAAEPRFSWSAAVAGARTFATSA